MTTEVTSWVEFMAEISRMNHVEDIAVIIAGLFFFVTFFSGTFIIYDAVRKADKRKVYGSKMSYTITALGMAFYSLSLFGAVRLIDRINDAQFVLLNPNAVTTLSQQSLYTEIPLAIAALAILIFDIFYVYVYLKMRPVKERIDEAGDFRR